MAQDVVATSIPNRASVVPGPDDLHRLTRVGEWYKSGSVASTDTTSINLLELPGNSLVVNAFVYVTTAFEASGASTAATATLTIPNDTGGTETIWDAAAVGLQATGAHWATGVAVVPSSGGYVVLAYSPQTTTVGALEVYVEVVQFSDRLAI